MPQLSSAVPISPSNVCLEDARRRSVTYHPSEISVAENEELERQKEAVRAQIFQDDSNDLHFVALRFRLLRQQGYYVPCDVFNKFMDEEGNFKARAAHLGIDGEDILDKAISFCSSLLELHLVDQKNNYNYLAKQVSEALNIPIRKSAIRLGARKFISIYQENESHNKTLLNFAKSDFNIVQKIHQKELSDLTRWWKDLDFANKLPFARDRMVECYFWIVTVYFEPKHHIARRILTKVIALTSIIDDIYDVHGTLDELQLFTDFIQSWDDNALEQLPEYMRICCTALFDVYLQIEVEMRKTDTLYRVHYAKEEMKKLVRAYLEEAKWCYTKYTPTMEEYMKVSLVSGAYMMLSTTSIVASSVICRLRDDMVGHGFEEKLTAVELFAEFEKQVKKAWKDINKECIGSTASSFPILSCVLNLARLINLLYSDEDGYTNSNAKTKEIIQSVLVEPVTI
ncbi:hypothetical protein ABFX02_08G103600 [Erythranthe guttata]